MKINNFKPKEADSQARYLAKLLPRGRAWNSQSSTYLFKLVKSLSTGLNQLIDLIWQLIQEFMIDSSTFLLSRWEQSLGIVPDESLTISERRSNVKAQIKKTNVVTVEEWESQISKALGKPVKVYPAGEFVPDSCFYLPNPVPTPLFLVHPDRMKQNRFVLYIDEINGTSEARRVRKIIKKFNPTNVYAIIIDRDYFF